MSEVSNVEEVSNNDETTTIVLKPNQSALVFTAADENSLEVELYLSEMKEDSDSVSSANLYCAAVAYLSRSEEFIEHAIALFSEQIEKMREENEVSHIQV